MNREQRRTAIKKYRRKGLSKQEAEHFANVQEHLSQPRHFSAGDKVCLRYEKLIHEPGFEDRLPAYREFVKNHKTTVLTVEIPPEYEHRCLVTLAEDTHEPKWLWWEGDLRRPNEPDE